MLNYDQAVYFLENILRMPPQWRDYLQNKPMEFLKLYMKRHAVRIPFQNLQMAAVDPCYRWFPSENDIIYTGMNGKGGCCIHLNYFTKLVFQAIGLDSFVVRGDHYSAPVAGTHCLAMVRLYGPSAGLYLVEVGGAFPMLEPIPMDRERLPYRTLQAGGFPYEFREFAEGWIGKFHLKGGLNGGAYTDKQETLRTSWDLKPRGLWEFDYPMLETFTNPTVSSMLRHPLMYRHFTNTEFKRLFPELPENADYKEKVLVSKPMSKIGKVLAASGRPKPQTEKKSKIEEVENKPAKDKKENEKKTLTEKPPVTNGKSHPITNGTKVSPLGTVNNKTQTQNGKQEVSKLTKQPSIPPSKTLIIPTEDDEESDDDEYEVVTEEEISEEEDDPEEEPKNFIFAWKRRIVIADANSRKIVKDYKSFQEMGEDLKKYFPKIPIDAVDKSMKIFSEYEVVPTSYDAII